MWPLRAQNQPMFPPQVVPLCRFRRVLGGLTALPRHSPTNADLAAPPLSLLSHVKLPLGRHGTALGRLQNRKTPRKYCLGTGGTAGTANFPVRGKTFPSTLN